jgi:hypothetical protein
MAISDEQSAAMRAMLAGDFDEHWRLAERLDQVEGWQTYNTLLVAAFFRAVERRFGGGSTDAEIVKFVADARARFDQSGNDIDPGTAERLVLAALGKASVDGLDDEMVVRTETVLLSALVIAENLDDDGLDKFMKEARELANEWIAADQA